MSRFLLLTAGTRGDVQPFVALGRGLRAAGHDVRLATHERFRGFVEVHGVPFAPLRNDLLRYGETPEGRALTEGGGNPIRALRVALPIYAGMLRDAQAAAADGFDVVVHHPKTLAGPSLAERHGACAVRVLPVPALTPTRAFPLPLLAQRDLGAFLNRASYAPVAASDRPFAGVLRAWRRELGLPASPAGRGGDGATLYPVSEAVVPRPVDWPTDTRLTGYWFLNDPAPMPADVEAFLEAGRPPFVVGFSSLVGRDPVGRTRTVLEALAAVDARAVLVSGWGGLDADSLPLALRGRVHVVDAVPFERLFPRALAVVHHGGAGTTAEALRAGVPSLVVPFFGDQRYWGARVAALGVGPTPIPQARLDAAGLRRALERLRDDGAMRAAAAEVGRRLRAEDGVRVAVAALEELAPP